MKKGDFKFCKDKINEFLNKNNKDIDFLKDFSFLEFRNSDRYFDYKEYYYSEGHEDNFQLARFIYIVLWGYRSNNDYAIPCLNNAWDSFGENLYCGETINTYSTLIGENDEKIKVTLSKKEQDILKSFREKYLTIGNFMVLPKQKPIGNAQTLNQIKGSLYYNDLADKFYFDLFESKILDAYAHENRLKANDFCKKFFLEPYFDLTNGKCKPKIIFNHSFRENGNTYKDFIIDYATKAINIINYRAERICAILKDRLKS